MFTEPDPASPAALQRLVLGDDALSQLAALDALLTDQLFDIGDGAADPRDFERTYRRLQALIKLSGGSLALHKHPARMLTALEWAATVDPGLFLIMLDHSLCTTTIAELAQPSPLRDAVLDGLDSVQAPGSVAITEVGWSNSHISPALEASYDPAGREFVLRTPGPQATKIMPNLAWFGMPRTGVVYAQLLVNGQRCGLFPFMLSFDASATSVPGVHISPVPGTAPIVVDYARIHFGGARIPYDAWLRDSASITPDGQYDDPFGDPDRRMMRSLFVTQNAFASASAALIAAGRASVVIALRHASQRTTMGRLAPPGTPLLDYDTQREALYGALADVYAVGFLVKAVRERFAEQRRQSEDPTARQQGSATWAPWIAVHRDLAAAKSCASQILEQAIAECRRRCGAQGVLTMNRLIGYDAVASALQAAAGDTLLNRLDLGKSMIEGAGYRPPAALAATAADAAPADSGRALRLTIEHERTLHAELRAEVDQRRKQADSEFKVWNSLLPDAVRLADLYARRLTLECFDDAAHAADGTPAKEPLRALQALYGLNILRSTTAWHLEHRTMTAADVKALRAAYPAALAAVHANLSDLVDGLALPP